MRLLDVRTLELRTFYGDAIPMYAILSHNWLQDHEEVTFAQMHNVDACRNKAGFRKIQLLCQQAKRDDVQYAWIDTCCIDKMNSSELSEAINSMFAWYSRAKYCYVYLADICAEQGDDFLDSRWWTRAWTLQELLAPNVVSFYDTAWKFLGEKSDWSITVKVSSFTGIDERVLMYPRKMFRRSIAQRMSWAATREATRQEDLAYCLLGLFKIHMPLQYGEGIAAFLRLQKEILKRSHDQSLFAWSPTSRYVDEVLQEEKTIDSDNESVETIITDYDEGGQHGMFAPHPKFFANCGDMAFLSDSTSNWPLSEVNGGLNVKIPLIPPDFLLTNDLWIGLLPCVARSQMQDIMGILLSSWGEDNRYKRVGRNGDMFTFPVKRTMIAKAQVQEIWIDDWWRASTDFALPCRWRNIKISIASEPLYPSPLLTMLSPENAVWDADSSILCLQGPSDWMPDFVQLGLSISPDPPVSVNLELGTSVELEDRVRISWIRRGAMHRLNAYLLTQGGSNIHHFKFEKSATNVRVTVTSRRIFNQLLSEVNIEIGSRLDFSQSSMVSKDVVFAGLPDQTGEQDAEASEEDQKMS
jgi:hypothetical protein